MHSHAITYHLGIIFTNHLWQYSGLLMVSWVYHIVETNHKNFSAPTAPAFQSSSCISHRSVLAWPGKIYSLGNSGTDPMGPCLLQHFFKLLPRREWSAVPHDLSHDRIAEPWQP